MLVAYGYGFGMYRMYFDWTYLLIIAGVIPVSYTHLAAGIKNGYTREKTDPAE